MTGGTMSNLEESILRNRVSGLSGLGLAEEQRVRKAITSLLKSPQSLSEQDIEQLEIQAIRLGITTLRHQLDQEYIRKDILSLESQVKKTGSDISALKQEAEKWKVRNALFEEYERAGERVQAAGPPVKDLYASIDAVSNEVSDIMEQCDDERRGLLEDANKLSSLFDSIKSFI
jgi:hypothetical protein